MSLSEITYMFGEWFLLSIFALSWLEPPTFAALVVGSIATGSFCTAANLTYRLCR